MLHTINNLLHTGIGTFGLLGGLVALLAVKGSRRHVLGGKVFAWSMAAIVVTTMLTMLDGFLPLAVVLALAEVYLVPSALLSVNRGRRDFRAWSIVLMGIPGLLCLFAGVQFVLANRASDTLLLGPLVLCVMFGFLFLQDWRMLANRPTHPNVWLRRHFVRMILAFTIAIMALVRIGLRFGLSLEASVVIPLAVATLAILWVYRRYPVTNRPTSAETGAGSFG